jgi:hypothetical protein
MMVGVSSLVKSNGGHRSPDKKRITKNTDPNFKLIIYYSRRVGGLPVPSIPTLLSVFLGSFCPRIILLRKTRSLGTERRY